MSEQKNTPRMNHRQSRRMQGLVHLCCNYDHGNCLALDNGWDSCVCAQRITFSLSCKWFRAAVLPQDPQLEAELLRRADQKKCVVCGGSFVPKSNRAKYCPECAAKVQRRQKTESERRRRTVSVER